MRIPPQTREFELYYFHATGHGPVKIAGAATMRPILNDYANTKTPVHDIVLIN